MPQLAAAVRAKYPGVYDDLSDADLEKQVLAKFPQYQDLAMPPAVGKSQSAETTVNGLRKAGGMAVQPLSMGPAQPASQVAADAAKWAPAAGGAIGGALAGPFGAAAGGAVGSLVKQGVRVATGADTQPRAGVSPTAAADVVIDAAIQGTAQKAGDVVGQGMRAGGSWLMEKAVKPTLTLLKQYHTTTQAIAKTLLDEGISVTPAGLDKLQTVFARTNQEISDAVANAPGRISKNVVAARALPTARKIAQQVNPTQDLQAVGDTVHEFLNHPILTGPTVSVPEAQAMKVGTYQQIGKKYGEVASASIETQKALARGLKEEIAAEVPGLAGLNSKDAELMAALDAVGRRVALSGNKDPVGFAWVAQHPMTFIAALLDRSPAVKSMIARGLYSGAGAAGKVSPQLIRAAVTALATSSPAGSPPPALSDSSARPGNQ